VGFTSRREGIPNRVLETLRAHCPVVATRVGLVPEVVKNPLAHLVEPRSSKGLAKARLQASMATPSSGEI
jgi:glycosyltransferase involved in cell wall biosynthesis